MPLAISRNRLRLITSTLCLIMAALVFVWGSAFKASLYHSFRDLANIPAAKLLTEQERPAQAICVDNANDGIPHAPQAASLFAAMAAPRLAPLQTAALLPPAHLTPIQSNAALGFYFHHPPPVL
jgi:hypothetical protein